MFEIDHTSQPSLFATTPRDWLDKDSDVWIYIDLFKELDLKEFRDDYSFNGRPSKEPEYILRSLFYGLTHRVTSVRGLTEACRNDLRFIVLSGNQKPNRRTIDRFIRRHSLRMESLFIKVVELAGQAGMVSLGRLAIDGSRFKAKANRQKGMKYGKMDRAIGYLKEDLAELRHSLEEAEHSGHIEKESRISKDLLDKERRIEKIRAAKKKIEKDFETRVYKNSPEQREKVSKSIHDVDAQAMAGKGEGFNYGYNAQAVVDEQNQIIIAADIHDNASDSQALPKMLDQVEQTIGQTVDGVEIMADFGYRSAENIFDIEQRGAKPFIPHKSNKKNETEVHFAEQVTYDEATDKFTCMAGKVLNASTSVKANIESTRLSMGKNKCCDCPLQKTCKMWKNNKQRNNVIVPGRKKFLTFQRSIQYSRTEEFLEKYRRRKVIVEPVFGNIKNKQIRINVIGAKSVKTWWKIACIAHNLEKIAKNRAKIAFIGILAYLKFDRTYLENCA